jgi:hypothetical protein
MHDHLIELAIGILLLLFGRKLFWLFVAVIGFLSGMQLASQFFPNESRLVILAVALALGLLGAILAIFLQHAVVVLAGFLAGGHLVYRFLTLVHWQNVEYSWWIILVGGILGGILALLLLDWALIIFSSLIGASLISQALPLDQATASLLIILFAIGGILIQSRLIQRPVAV